MIILLIIYDIKSALKGLANLIFISLILLLDPGPDRSPRHILQEEAGNILENICLEDEHFLLSFFYNWD